MRKLQDSTVQPTAGRLPPLPSGGPLLEPYEKRCRLNRNPGLACYARRGSSRHSCRRHSTHRLLRRPAYGHGFVVCRQSQRTARTRPRIVNQSSRRHRFVATHLGVYRVANGVAERIADRTQDTMAFTMVGPDHFLASSHLDLRDDLPAHLGLIESTDAAATWQSVSLGRGGRFSRS